MTLASASQTTSMYCLVSTFPSSSGFAYRSKAHSLSAASRNGSDRGGGGATKIHGVGCSARNGHTTGLRDRAPEMQNTTGTTRRAMDRWMDRSRHAGCFKQPSACPPASEERERERRHKGRWKGCISEAGGGGRIDGRCANHRSPPDEAVLRSP